MPAPVASFAGDTFPGAKALNIALYTCDGTADNPNGIAFHAYRPVLFDSYSRTLTIPASSGGTQTTLSSSGTVTACQVVYDTAGYSGQYQDQPGGGGYYQFLAAVDGSSGDGVTAGGWTLLSHFAPLKPVSTQTSVSADLTGTAQAPVSGTRQAPSGSLDSCPFFLDLVNAGAATTWSPAVTARDSAGSATTNAVNATDSSGETPRFYAVWAAVSATSAGRAAYSAAGTFPFTAPAGVTSITAAPTAAGSGGGAGNSSGGGVEHGGGGAGGGEFAKGTVAVTPGNSYPVTVGAGGAEGVTGVASGDGAAGGDSVFAGDSASIHAHAGSGGSGASTSAGGAGGAGGTGACDTHSNGGAGATGPTAAGGGGGSGAGTGQAGVNATSTAGAPAPVGGGPGGAGGQAVIQVVQAAHSSNTGTNFLTVTMKAAFQAGNSVLCLLYYQGDSPHGDPTVTLSDGTPLTLQVNGDVTSNVSLQVGLFDVYNIAGGQTGIKIACHGGRNSVKAILCEVYEVAGLGPSPSIDVSSSHTQGPSAPNIFYESSPSGVTTNKAPELWVAMVGAQYTSPFSIGNPASSQGWASDGPRYANHGAIFGGILTARQVKSVTGTMQFSGTFSRGATKGTLAAAYATSAVTAGAAPVIGPGGGGGGGLGAGNSGGAGADGQVILTWTEPSGSGYGTPALPAPYTTWSAATTVGTNGSAQVDLNGSTGIRDVCNFLSNPPVLRVSATTAQAITTGTLTSVTFGAAAAATDNYSGWNSGTATYTVQRDGLHLFHGLACFSASSAGLRAAAVTVNGTSYWGPPSPAPSAGTANVPKTQILDLQAGDTVQFACYQTSGGTLNLATTDQTRFLLAYLCETGVPSSLWAPPDTTFRWQAGAQGEDLGGNLADQFQQHLANDLGFLANRPYLLAFQGFAQSGLTASAFTTVNLGSVEGMIHLADGDNYAGWTAGPPNFYTAQVPGWYLACGEFFSITPAGSIGPTVIAGLQVPSSGGVAPAHGTDYYQQATVTTATSWGGGATVFGLVYLQAGETVTPVINGNGYSGTYTTNAGPLAGGTFRSHLGLVWISE